MTHLLRPRRSQLATLAATFGLFALLMLVSGPRAQAHDPSVYHPTDPFPYAAFPSVVTIRANHTRVDVCDRHADGHRVYARVMSNAGRQQRPPVTISGLYDKDDYGGACNQGYFFSSGVYQYNICVQYEGCGSPKYIWQP